jgi:peroxisomal membrane protein 2
MRFYNLLLLALAGKASIRSSTTHAFAVVGPHKARAAPYRTNNNFIHGGETRLGAIGGLVEAWDAYNAALESDPLIVKSITSGVILGAADFTGQALEKVRSGTDKDVDFARAARFAFFGLVLQAPWNHFYYLLLDGQIPPTADPFSNTNIAKVCIDQFIQAPIFTVLIFAFLGALEGKGLEDIKKQLENDYPETIVANCE